MKQSAAIAQQIIRCFKQGNKILLCGNGGSASMSAHMAGEFLCKIREWRKPLPAIDLTGNMAVVTAIANDLGYEYVFSRQIDAFGKPGDILLIFTTSSPLTGNKLHAYQKAIEKGMDVIIFPRRGNRADLCQNYQEKLMHEVCVLVENAFL